MMYGVPLELKAAVSVAVAARRAAVGATAMAVVLSGSVFEPAAAQTFFNFGTYNSPSGTAAAKRKRQKPAKISRATPAVPAAERQTPKSAAKTEEAIVQKPENPLLISVSLRRQRVSVFDGDKLMMEAPISSGKFSTPTPTGVFSILQKNRVHFSNLYDSAPMPNMQRITWSGVALHAGQLPGYPASHGCIRLPHQFSKKLFGLTSLGTRVIVAQETAQPTSFSHETLFAAYPDKPTTSHALVPAEATRVADAASVRQGPPVEVGSVLGVSTALAAEGPSAFDQIAALRAARQDELSRLATAVADADKAKNEAVEKAKAALQTSNDRKLAVRTARGEADRLSAAARKASQQHAAADKKLEAFAKRMSRKPDLSPEQIAKAAGEEDRLETAAMDAADRAASATIAAERAEAAFKAAEDAASEAETARAEAAKAVRQLDADLAAAREAEAAAKRRAAKRNQPVHVFISRKTQKLYVRQGYEPILESPVTIESPEKPLGTHVFTALQVEDQQNGPQAKVSWSVASIPTIAAPKLTNARDKKQRAAQAAAAAKLAAEARMEQTAAAALARVVIPQDVRLQIEDVMKPGSSLIVSDNGLSNETGKFTDFIVPVR